MALVREQPSKAEQLLTDLSDLFRATLRNPRSTISLQEEIELAQRYLDIEQVRFGDRLQVEWLLDPAARPSAPTSAAALGGKCGQTRGRTLRNWHKSNNFSAVNAKKIHFAHGHQYTAPGGAPRRQSRQPPWPGHGACERRAAFARVT